MWQGIRGHDEIVERFRRSLASGRLASTYLFVGPAGVGKRTLALNLARGLLCQENGDEKLDPCGRCESCRLAEAGTHPDLLVVGLPEGKSYIPLETLIGESDRRMQSGLCHDIAMKPFLGGRKVAVIDDAEFLNVEGANCLLKTLEEPPPRSLMILLATSAARQLPTIRSRAQIMRFQPLPVGDVADLLIETGQVDDREEAELLASWSEGSVSQALTLAEPGLRQFGDLLVEHLSAPVVDSVQLARETSAFVDEAGKEAFARRRRTRTVIGIAIDYYRQMMRLASGAPDPAVGPLETAVSRGLDAWQGDAELAAACVDRCIDALGQVDRNANQSTLIESWLDDLERMAAGGGPYLTTSL